MKTRRSIIPPKLPDETMRVSRRGLLGVVAGVAGVTGLVAAKLARADDQRAESVPLPLYGETKVFSICQQCVGGCGITARNLADQVVGVAGDPKHPVSRGGACARLFGALQLLHAPNRVKGPMVKDGARGKLKATTWDDALKLVNDKLTELRGRGEAHTLAILGGQYRGTRHALWSQFARAYGTPNYIRVRDRAPEQPALALRYMNGATVPFAYDIGEAQLVVSFGADVVEGWQNPVFGARSLTRLRRTEDRQRGRFIQVEPRRSPTAIKADRWVSLEPGTEGIFALGLANVLIREQLYDVDFVAAHTLGFEDWDDPDGTHHEGFKTIVLRDYGLLAVSDATGVPVNTILDVARELGGARPALIIGERGPAFGEDDLRTRMSIHSLNALVGAIGARGGVVPQAPLPLTGLPALAPDAATTASLALPRLDGAGRGDWLFASDASQNVPAAILAGKPYPVNALFLFATNPLVEHPAKDEFARALEKVPFVVTFASFLDETTAAADLVLPDSFFLERWQDDYVTHLAGFSCYSLAQPVVPAFEQTRNTADVVLALARAQGGSVAQALPFESFDGALKHVTRGLFDAGRGHVAGTMADESLYRTMERQGYWAPEFDSFDDFFDALSERGAWFDVPDWPIGYKASFATESGKFEFHASKLAQALDAAATGEGGAAAAEKLLRPGGGKLVLPVAIAAKAAPDTTYPLLLNVYELATRPLGGAREQSWLQEQPSSTVAAAWENWAELNPATARKLGVRDGERVVVESAKGKLTLLARVTHGAREDMVNIPLYEGSDGNPFALIANTPDYFGGFGLLNTTRVRVRRA